MIWLRAGLAGIALLSGAGVALGQGARVATAKDAGINCDCC